MNNYLPERSLTLCFFVLDLLKSSSCKIKQNLGFSIVLMTYGLSASCSAQSAKLTDWTSTQPQWEQTKPGLAHFSSYCSTLYDVVSDFYANHPIPQQRRNANIFLSRSHIYSRIGFFLSLKGGVSAQQAMDNHWVLKSHMNDIFQFNAKERESISDQSLTDELEICQNHVTDVKEMAKDLEIEFESKAVSLTEPVAPVRGPLDKASLSKIWSWIKTQTSAPEDAGMPDVVIRSNLPPAVRLMFEYPSDTEPDNLMQISVSTRTLDSWSRPMVNWAIGHEFLHYALLMRENNWKSQIIYKKNIKHHCNPEFIDLTAGIAELISDAQPPARERLSMYSEIFRSCARYPDQ